MAVSFLRVPIFFPSPLPISDWQLYLFILILRKKEVKRSRLEQISWMCPKANFSFSIQFFIEIIIIIPMQKAIRAFLRKAFTGQILLTGPGWGPTCEGRNAPVPCVAEWCQLSCGKICFLVPHTRPFCKRASCHAPHIHCSFFFNPAFFPNPRMFSYLCNTHLLWLPLNAHTHFHAYAHTLGRMCAGKKAVERQHWD